MSLLPILNPDPSPAPTVRARRGKPVLAVMLRVVLMLLLAGCMRVISEQRTNAMRQSVPAIELADVRSLVPQAAVLEPGTGQQQAILNSAGQTLAWATTTLPDAKKVVGYRGPSNVLLILNEHSAVTAAKLVDSEDTPEHVDAVLRDPDFFEQFAGWKPGPAQPINTIDAVSGATLTSLAIAEGIAVRLGSEKPSLKFPDELSEEDLQLVFDAKPGWNLQIESAVEANVCDASGQPVGRLLRTGPLVDSIAGYQGPTELLIALDPGGMVLNIAVRRTFDNQPYAGYLNQEPWFWKAFQQQTLTELQALDPEAEMIEGVSGATMTSLAVADTVVAAAKAYVQQRQEAKQQTAQRTLRWSNHDTGTVLVLACGILIGLTRLRGNRWIRNLWNLTLVIYFGLITGNLISLAVVMGWAASGVAWQLAPGLTLVVFVGLMLPPLTRRNLYCSHLCPHGAAQQLLKNRLRTKWQLPQRAAHSLKWLPGTILILAIGATLTSQSWNLAAWEPFNAWIWYVAGISSIVLAIGSLAASTVIPMFWCRYGCATGRLLEYARRSARAHRFTTADLIATTLTAMAITVVAINVIVRS